jgi:hypothetical protein
MELPYHRSFEEDIVLLPKEKPAQLVFDLHPTSNVFNAGHRIRVTIACADQNNYQTPELSPPPRITVYHSSDYPSSISLPVFSPGIDATDMTTLFIIVIVIVILIFAVIFLYMFLRSRLKTE